MDSKKAHQELQEIKALTREFYDIIKANDHYALWLGFWICMDNSVNGDK